MPWGSFIQPEGGGSRSRGVWAERRLQAGQCDPTHWCSAGAAASWQQHRHRHMAKAQTGPEDTLLVSAALAAAGRARGAARPWPCWLAASMTSQCWCSRPPPAQPQHLHHLQRAQRRQRPASSSPYGTVMW